MSWGLLVKPQLCCGNLVLVQSASAACVRRAVDSATALPLAALSLPSDSPPLPASPTCYAPLQTAEALEVRRKSDAFAERVEAFRAFFLSRAPFGAPNGGTELTVEQVRGWRARTSQGGHQGMLLMNGAACFVP